jgi:hypothetical protein
VLEGAFVVVLALAALGLAGLLGYVAVRLYRGGR